MPTRILITDDALFMRVTLRRILTENGYEIVGEAENGADAIAMYAQLKPDLVTMDITMPEMDGITALRAIRELDCDATVLMCTAMSQKNLVIEAMAAGAKDFLLKPYHRDRVLESVAKFAA